MRVLLGITGGIAAFKMLSVASALIKNNHEVEVCMTEEACKFVTPLSFEAITHRPVILKDDQFLEGVANQHIRLSKFADVMVIAPASANTIAKLSVGIGDNIVTLTALACTSKKIVYPAMNVNMYLNEITQNNIKKLKTYKEFEVVEPKKGYLACGDFGEGRLPEPNYIYETIMFYGYKDKDMVGKKVLVNAGPTKERIDPVRFITNHSTGKMGYEIARAFAYRGADVTLVTGDVEIVPPYGIKVIKSYSAEDMYNDVLREKEGKDIVVLSAAVADYTPIKTAKEKIKKSQGNLSIELKRTKDILRELGKDKKFILVGFAMETENLIENAKGKLNDKNADLIVANSINQEGAGFAVDTNVATLIGKDGIKKYPKMSKFELANIIIDEIKEGEIYARIR